MIKKGRGRPRQYPIVLDKGTPEQQLKRLALVDGGNPVKKLNIFDHYSIQRSRGYLAV